MDKIKENKEVLNRFNFLPCFKPDSYWQAVNTIMDKARDLYNQDPTLPSDYEGDIFYYLTEAEVQEYLAERYDLTSVEQERIEYFLVGNIIPDNEPKRFIEIRPYVK